jgi:hypothetical protein
MDPMAVYVPRGLQNRLGRFVLEAVEDFDVGIVGCCPICLHGVVLI